MDSDEKKLRHLEMIQAVISRMAQNSFTIKAWTVTLVAGLFALAADKSDPVFVLITFVPVIAFWILDGYFLWQERLFRRLYDLTRKGVGNTDYSMDTNSVMQEVHCWACAIISNTLLIFYGVLIATLILISMMTYNFC